MSGRSAISALPIAPTTVCATTRRGTRRVRATRWTRQRGITITATHVEYETEKRHYSHVDCPGHQHYIKNMITGATQMDGVILVVSVTEGPQEQTREHIILAREVGIEYMVVYVNKVDAMKASVLKNLVEIEILELMDIYSFSRDDRNLLVFGSARDAL